MTERPTAPATAIGRRASCEVELCAPIDFDDWHRRYELGQVAERLPYGFDRLVGYDVGIRTTTVSSPRRSVRGLVGGRRSNASSDWILTWDERSAVATAQSGVAAARSASGLIWATDHLERSTRRIEMSVLKRYLQRLDVLWCLSRPQVELANAWLNPRDGGGPRIEFIPFGINTEHFDYAPYPEAQMVLSIGNDPDRDMRTAVDAMMRIRQAHPDVRLVLQSNSLEHAPPGIELIRSADHDELLALYANASVVLIATKPNTHVSGMTVALEAQSIGRPVVMTYTAGVADYLSPQNQTTIAPGDASGLASRVCKLLADDAGELGRAGREFVEQAHTSELMMSSLSALLELPSDHS